MDPITLRLTAEAARKNTLYVMDELSQRLQDRAEGPSLFQNTAPEDVLPKMPLRETSSSSQGALPVSPQKSPQEIPETSSRPYWNPPVDNSTENASHSLTQYMPSKTALSRIFSTRSRPYYLMPPLPSSPDVVPSYKVTEDPKRVLEDGREAVARLWDAVDDSWNRPHSAPLPQRPWNQFLQDEIDPDIPHPHVIDIAPPSPEVTSPRLIQNATPQATGAPVRQSGMRAQSGPVFTFSTPAPRFRRNVSGPPKPS